MYTNDISKYYHTLFLNHQVKQKLSQFSKKLKDIDVYNFFKKLKRYDLMHVYKYLHPLLKAKIKLKLIKYIYYNGL